MDENESNKIHFGDDQKIFSKMHFPSKILLSKIHLILDENESNNIQFRDN